MRNLKPALDLIKEFEGVHLNAYRDPVNIPTIGWGTIQYPNGQKVKMGDKITSEQADEYLMYEVQKKADAVRAYVKVPVNDNQYGALVSFAYNVGTGALKKSTLLRKLNAGDYMGAANEFKRWNKAGGKVLRGLVRRRAAEEAVFRKEMQEMPPAPEEPKQGWYVALKDLLMKLIEAFTGPVDPKVPEQQPLPEPAPKTLSKGSGPRISREEVEAILKKEGADTTKVCLLGIRGYYLDSMGVKGKNDRGVWDDALIWFFPEGFMTYRANTDPSRVRKGYGKGSKKGMANLMEGHWTYKMGMHNGSRPHPAFRQAAVVTVLRDGTPNYKDTGWFGINIHSGGRGTSSLGCQTLPRQQWKSFKELGYEKLDQYGQKTFSYVLVHEDSRR